MENLPLVGYHVNEMLMRVPSHVTRDDLASAGSLALVQAAQAYDASTGVPFSRYAAIRIRGALVDELRSMDWFSRGARQRARRLATISDQLTGELGRTPTREELAAAMGADVTEVDAARSDASRKVLSMDAYEGAVADTVSDDALGPEESVLVDERIRYLRSAVATLPERLRTVVEQIYFHDRPVTEIASEMGVTQSRVSQLRAEAMVLMRDGMNATLDPDQLQTPAKPEGVAERRRQSYFTALAEHAAHAAEGAASAGRELSAAARAVAHQTNFEVVRGGAAPARPASAGARVSEERIRTAAVLAEEPVLDTMAG